MSVSSVEDQMSIIDWVYGHRMREYPLLRKCKLSLMKNSLTDVFKSIPTRQLAELSMKVLGSNTGDGIYCTIPQILNDLASEIADIDSMLRNKRK